MSSPARRRPDDPGAPPTDAAMIAPDGDIYDPAYVRRLFDEMAHTYERVNLITSFGFSRRWRRQAVERLRPEQGATIADWMTGMGEGWPFLARRIGDGGRILAWDLSPAMIAGARRRAARGSGWTRAPAIEVNEGDALATDIPDASVDGVLVLFGLKTLGPDQVARLARELRRVLRPGGRCSLVEVSVPPFGPLRVAYLFYLKRIIPVLGRMLLGNPENYRMLGVYTERFGTVEATVAALADAGLETERASYFFGCATGVVGRRPGSSPGG